MICPACRHLMIAVEYKQIELDFCPHCHGTWCDRDELSLLLECVTGKEESSMIRSILAAPAAGTSEMKRKCPVCGKKMKKARVGKQAGVLLDACEQGDGIWLDGGEIDQLVQTIDDQGRDKAEHDHVFSFMKEVFSK